MAIYRHANHYDFGVMITILAPWLRHYDRGVNYYDNSSPNIEPKLKSSERAFISILKYSNRTTLWCINSSLKFGMVCKVVLDWKLVWNNYCLCINIFLLHLCHLLEQLSGQVNYLRDKLVHHPTCPPPPTKSVPLISYPANICMFFVNFMF